MKAFEWLEPSLTMDGTVTVRERRRRYLFFWINAVEVMFVLLYLIVILLDVKERYVLVVALVTGLCAGCFAMAAVLFKKELTTKVILGVVLGHGVNIALADLTARCAGSETAILLVLVVDLLLVMQVDPRCCFWFVCASVVWIVVMAMEERFRFGLLDLPGLLSYSERRERLAELSQCDSVPCGRNNRLVYLFVSLQVFVIDFLATRGFASVIVKEQAAMQRTINAVQEIASLLARYDVEGVARMLDAQETLLPEEMHATLRKMEGNLRKYRPYLPAALFEEMDAEDVSSVRRNAVVPPGLDNVATIVFTDIRASTSIWEAAPDGMRAGLRIHNTVIRDVMHTFGGYEVKTIGDAFMIAFATTQDGMDFALKVHERLREAEWPPSLMEDAPICAKQGLLWCGLTVRIGINTGPVTAELNTLTGRMDYFGHTVNVASRLETICSPGAVAICSALWSSECNGCNGIVGDTAALDLKGVSGNTFVSNIWAKSLAGRKHVFLRDPTTGRAAPDDTCCDSLASSLRSRATERSDLAGEASRIIAGSARLVSATVGVTELSVGDEQSPVALHNMSVALTTLTVALDQSGGVVVTLLGSYVCVGWNVTRSAPAHTEAAVRFVSRLMNASCVVNGAGLVSGVVQHGDVGARSQRFVTVVGRCVRRSWTLCEEAVRCGNVCLFAPPEGHVTTSLGDVLVPHKGSHDVYRLVC